MKFDWNPAKRIEALGKHGIDFADAVRIFAGDVIEWCDIRQWDEVRVGALGCMDDLEIVVVYTMRGETRWIITVRRARRKERMQWHEAFG